MNVVIAVADEEAGAETAAEFGRLGNVRFIPCDVSVEKQVQDLMDASVAAFGAIDALVKNTGVSRFMSLDALSLTDWRGRRI